MQNMVKLLKQSSISLHFEKHKGVNGDYKAQRTQTQSTTFKQKYQAWPNEDNNIFLRQPKMTERYGERVDDRLEAGYRGS